MMPPLNKKNPPNKREDTQTESRDNDFVSTKAVPAKMPSTNKDFGLDPLEGLAKEENEQMKKFYEKQIEFQKSSI